MRENTINLNTKLIQTQRTPTDDMQFNDDYYFLS